VNRALRAATTVVLLVSPVALSACSAGQVTQTATQERDKTGGMAQVGALTLRQVRLFAPDEGRYERGDDAVLRLAVVNNGSEADTLVDVSGEGFGGVEFDDGSRRRSSSVEGIEIPADSAVFIDGDELAVTLTDLDKELTTGQYLEVTLVFQKSGKVTIPVTVDTPPETVERGEAFDFHHEEGGEEEGSGDAARERESAEHN
jgi:copper(I)-binding protein